MSSPKTGCAEENGQRQWECMSPQGNASRNKTNGVKYSTNTPLVFIYFCLFALFCFANRNKTTQEKYEFGGNFVVTKV